VEVFLQELAERPGDKGGPLAVLLPRAAGAKEPRWTHLLSGPVLADSTPTDASTNEPRVADTYRALLQRIEALEATVASQQAQLERMQTELGMSPA
jgi:uncharacterized protein